jgi:hypothetical protein
MLKAVGLLAIATLVAAFFVPFHGETLWQRVERHAFPRPVRSVRGTAPARPTKPAPAAPPAQGRRDRIVAEKPKEKLSGDDRAALDRLVTKRAR